MPSVGSKVEWAQRRGLLESFWLGWPTPLARLETEMCAPLTSRGCQLIMLARNEERQNRCPGCGARTCLRVLGANEC